MGIRIEQDHQSLFENKQKERDYERRSNKGFEQELKRSVEQLSKCRKYGCNTLRG